MNHQIIAAIKFAIVAHGPQARKYTQAPYVTHSIDVMQTLQRLHPDASVDMLVAAILHDTVEDTATTLADIEAAFGSTVTTLVDWLTDVSQPDDGNRKTRKQIDANHTHNAPFDAQVVKLADLIDNATSIVENDKSFAKVYLREKSIILNGMKPEVKQTRIWEEAHRILLDGMSQIAK